jgi:hypothetical protein
VLSSSRAKKLTDGGGDELGGDEGGDENGGGDDRLSPKGETKKVPFPKEPPKGMGRLKGIGIGGWTALGCINGGKSFSSSANWAKFTTALRMGCPRMTLVKP